MEKNRKRKYMDSNPNGETQKELYHHLQKLKAVTNSEDMDDNQQQMFEEEPPLDQDEEFGAMRKFENQTEEEYNLCDFPDQDISDAESGSEDLTDKIGSEGDPESSSNAEAHHDTQNDRVLFWYHGDPLTFKEMVTRQHESSFLRPSRFLDVLDQYLERKTSFLKEKEPPESHDDYSKMFRLAMHQFNQDWADCIESRRREDVMPKIDLETSQYPVDETYEKSLDAVYLYHEEAKIFIHWRKVLYQHFAVLRQKIDDDESQESEQGGDSPEL